MDLDLHSLWPAILNELKLQMTKATFNTWLQGTRPTAVGDGTLTIQVRSDYAKDWLENRMYDTILRTIHAVDADAKIQELKFVVGVDELVRPRNAQSEEAQETATSTSLSASVAEQPSFPGFEPLRSNFVQTPKQFFEIVLVDGPYVMRIFVGVVIAQTYGRILNFRTMERAEWWEADRSEIGRATGIKSLRSVDRAITEARARGFVIREQGVKHFKYRPREENELIDMP